MKKYLKISLEILLVTVLLSTVLCVLAYAKEAFEGEDEIGCPHYYNSEYDWCLYGKKCVKCGKVFENALGHNFRTERRAEDKTCYVEICRRCGKTFTRAHAGLNPEKDWCTEGKKCSICGYTSEALGHDLDSNEKCRRCGETECNHVYNVAKATCKLAKKCTKCGEVKDEVDPNNHNFRTTRDDKGTTKKCSWCGKEEVTPHDFDENNKCKICGYILKVKIEEHTHVAKENETPCTKDTVCKVCNEVLRKAGHRYGTTYKNDDKNHWLTCTVEGCDKESAKQAHIFKNGSNKCSICGFSKEGMTCKHSKENLVVAYIRQNYGKHIEVTTCIACGVEIDRNTVACTSEKTIDSKVICKCGATLVCGEKYTVNGHKENYYTTRYKQNSDGKTHEKLNYCSRCKTEWVIEDKEDHVYEYGKCKFCGYKQSGADYSDCNHKNAKSEYTYCSSAQHYTKKCGDCGKLLELEKHNFENGKCKDCKYECDHKGNEKITYNKIENDDENHEKVVKCGTCGKERKENENHRFKLGEQSKTIDGVKHANYDTKCMDCGYQCPHKEHETMCTPYVESVVIVARGKKHLVDSRCTKCLGDSIFQKEEEHDFQNSICTKCKYVCRHDKYKDGKCEFCGLCKEHNFEKGICAICGIEEGCKDTETHEHTLVCDKTITPFHKLYYRCKETGKKWEATEKNKILGGTISIDGSDPKCEACGEVMHVHKYSGKPIAVIEMTNERHNVIMNCKCGKVPVRGAHEYNEKGKCICGKEKDVEIAKCTKIKFEKSSITVNTGDNVDLKKYLKIEPESANVSVNLVWSMQTPLGKEIVKLNADGRIYFRQKVDGVQVSVRDKVTNKSASITVKSKGATIESNGGKDYSDVSKDSWYKDNVDKATEEGIFNGVSDELFEPEAYVTRGMFVTALARMDKADTKGYAKLFNDVLSDEYYSESIAWASANGIVNGVGDGKFAPDEFVTREEMSVMIYNYIKLQYKSLLEDSSESNVVFSDDDKISSWAKDAVYALAKMGLLNGKGDGKFAPQDNVTRAEAATILVRLSEKVVVSDCDHKGNEKITYNKIENDDDNHEKVIECGTCGKEIKENENHRFKLGEQIKTIDGVNHYNYDTKCMDCGYQCPHKEHEIMCTPMGEAVEIGRKKHMVDSRCTKCLGDAIFQKHEDHDFQNGICTKCEYVCRHDGYKDGKCEFCGLCKEHNFEKGICAICGIEEGCKDTETH